VCKSEKRSKSTGGDGGGPQCFAENGELLKHGNDKIGLYSGFTNWQKKDGEEKKIKELRKKKWPVGGCTGNCACPSKVWVDILFLVRETRGKGRGSQEEERKGTLKSVSYIIQEESGQH